MVRHSLGGKEGGREGRGESMVRHSLGGKEGGREGGREGRGVHGEMQPGREGGRGGVRGATLAVMYWYGTCC